MRRNVASIDDLVETIGADAAERFTDAPTQRITPSPRHRSARESLESLRQHLSRGGAPLRLSDTIGVGGEGVVRSATQLALSREVAVKTLRSDRRSGDAEERLLAEACIAGLLEHPNIVPVYDIELDDSGDLLIVFKKIEGEPWSAVVGRDASSVGLRGGLELDLDVLVRVCDAVAYAHDRGIVHHDLKPANVLLGRFGEVYLTDWGLAAAIDDRYGDRLPRLGESGKVFGTPAYMAPEMLDGGEVGTHTDVYLLGAMLYECLAGHPPHQHRAFPDVVESIRSGPIELPESAPMRLREICARAMSLDPACRHPDASSLKRDLETFGRERGALHILERASARLTELSERIAREEADGEAKRLAIYRMFAECRFGFSEVAETHPEAARAGLERAVTAMVAYELDRGAPEAAGVLLAELEAPPARALDAVTAARREKRAAEERIEALAEVGRRLDPMRGLRSRRLLVAVMGLLVLFPPAARLVAWYGRGVALPQSWGLLSSLALLVVLGAFAVRVRRSLRRSAVTRAVAVGVAVGLGFSLLVSALALLYHLPPHMPRLIWLFCASAIAATVALLYLPGFLPTSLVFAACGALLFLDPDDLIFAAWLSLTANAVMVANAVWLWWCRTEELATRDAPEHRPDD